MNSCDRLRIVTISDEYFNEYFQGIRMLTKLQGTRKQLKLFGGK